MKFMTEEQRRKYPALVVLAYQCQSYCMRTYGGCTDCGQMISGCEKVIEAGKRKEISKQ